MAKRSKGRGKPRASRKTSRRQTAARRPSIGSQLKRDDIAERTVGRGNLKKGPRTVAKTGNLTPTTRGFSALSKSLLAVQKAQRIRTARPRAFSFALQIRYRGPDGRFVKKIIEAGFPIPKAVQRRKRKGEKAETAFRRIVETEIKMAIFRTIDSQRDILGNSDELRATIKRANTKKARAALRRFKKQRGLTFKVDVRKE